MIRTISHIKKIYIFIFISSVALSLATLLSASAGFAEPTLTNSRIKWLPCSKPQFRLWFKDNPPAPTLECGRISAPLIYPDGREAGSPAPKRQVSLAITRSPATGRKKGSLVIIAGGPGMPGINPLVVLEGEAGKRLRESYDIIGYDPRGVGQSTPKISCASKRTRENVIEIDATGDKVAAAYIASCLKKTGRTVLEHMGTNEAVDDLNLLRQQLGEAFLTAVAYSYGTQVAALYAERYPESIRAIVLDGVVDRAEDGQTMLLNQNRGFQSTFERFVSFCNLEKSCPFKGGIEKATVDFHNLLKAIEDRQFPPAGDYELTAARVLAATNYSLMWKHQWAILGQALEALANGKTDKIKEQMGQELSEEEIDALLVITCADFASPTTDRQVRIARAKALKEAAPYANFNAEKVEINVCDMWPFTGRLRAEVPTLPASLPPLLFVAQRYDPTTPYINAQRMADYYRSPLISKNADGHTLVLTGLDQCVDREVVSYLLNPGEPRQDTTCD